MTSRTLLTIGVEDRQRSIAPRWRPAAEATVRPLVLELRGVRQSRHAGTVNEVEVLRGIDLRMHQGEFITVSGRSGSGKSALLNILGLLERPSGGQLSVCGCETTTLDDLDLARLRGRSVATLLQHHRLVTAYSVLENVMLPMLDPSGHATGTMHERAAALVARVGLAPWQHRRAGLLDIGQQQLVAVARALALGPALLLADEPTGNLDPKGAAAVIELLLGLNREQGTTVLFATANAALAARCGSTLHLADGRLGG